VAAFEQLQDDGKILAWGVSNFDVPDLDEIHGIAPDGHVVCNQVLYHLKKRAVERAVLPWCERLGAALIAYSPFGHGQFPGPRAKGGRVLQEIAAEHDATPRQVALAFLVRHRAVFAIPKAGGPEHAAENAGAGDLRLSDAELARISRAFPRGPRPRELPML